MFGIFRSRTSAHYFKEDVVSGGAAYIGTGRGYALDHNSFVKIYACYARRCDLFGVLPCATLNCKQANVCCEIHILIQASKQLLLLCSHFYYVVNLAQLLLLLRLVVRATDYSRAHYWASTWGAFLVVPPPYAYWSS